MSGTRIDFRRDELLRKIKKIREAVWEIPKDFRPYMNVPVRIYMTEDMLRKTEDGAIQQGINVASLPGIVGASIMLPDTHWGYGFPIGGVAAFDLEEGIISPGGVGYDINCGVRFLVTNLTLKDVKPRAREILRAMEKYIAAGVGRGGRVRVSASQMDELLENGAVWAVEQGYGLEEDLKHIEDGGRIEGADASKVSRRAKQRGFDQVGSLGSGNHYAEVEVVERIFDEKAAKRFGIVEEGQIGVMIHTGSRGLGHQVASDYIDVMMRAVRKYNLRLRDRQLACAPFQSPEAQDYLAAMRAAANFAFANRQILTHWVRQAFHEVFGDDVELKLLYDVAHNIAKVEKHTVDGETVKVVVHRKGATRGFAPGRPEIPEDYRDIGQPILVGGSMREGSYILLGTETAMKEVFGSTVHGAGRTLSRAAAKRRYRDEQIRRELERMGILVSAASRGEIAEESPDAYKSLEEVVNSAVAAGIAKKVFKARPIIVRKG